MNNKTALLGAVPGIVLLALASGFLLGREFPAHRYQVLSAESPALLLDTSTGRVCDLRPPKVGGAKDPADFIFGRSTGAKAATPSGFPYCGSQK